MSTNTGYVHLPLNIHPSLLNKNQVVEPFSAASVLYFVLENAGFEINYQDTNSVHAMK